MWLRLLEYLAHQEKGRLVGAAASVFALSLGLFSVGEPLLTGKKFGVTIAAQPYTITTRDSGGGSATTTEWFGSVIPQVDNQYSVGSSTRRWFDGWFAGVLNASSTTLTGTSTAITFAASRAGSAGNPTFTWTSDVDTGLYNEAANELDISTNGVKRLMIDTTNVSSTLAYAGPVGSAAVPTYTFNSDSNSGMYSVSNDIIGFSTAGANVGKIESAGFTMNNALPGGGGSDVGLSTAKWDAGFFSGTVTVDTAVSSTLHTAPDGTVSAPPFHFGGGGDADTGMYSPADNTIGLTAGGVESLSLSTTFVSTTVPVRVPFGTAAAPSFTFTGSTGYGFYKVNDTTLGFAAAGTEAFKVDSGYTYFTRSNIPSANNTYDLGTGTLNAWRNIYASGTTIVFGGLGAPTVSGNIVCFGQGADTIGKLYQQATNCTISSIRFKEHVESLDRKELMDRVRKLRAVGFDFKEGQGHGTLGTSHDEGFIAEEMAMIDPYLVVWERVAEDDEGLAKVRGLYPSVPRFIEGRDWMIPKTVDYSKVAMLLSGAVQDMDDRITVLENKMGFLDRFIQLFN